MTSTALDRIIRKLVNEDDNEESSEDFDKRVADLIVAEAREKNKGNSQSKSKSSLEQSSRRHTTNTRFLNNVVRGVQSHNRTVLSISASGEVEQSSRSESRHSIRDAYDEESQGESSEQARRSSRMRGWSDDGDQDGKHSVKKERGAVSRQKSTEKESERRLDRRHVSIEEKDRRSHRHRERDQHESRDRRRRSRSPQQRNSEDKASADRASTSDNLIASKMDRYFDERYDPMTDVRAETREDENGLIEDDGWDRMLQAIKDKEERKRLRKENRREDKARHHHHPRQEEDKKLKAESSVMQTQYTSRGKTREWDKGKETKD